jgi:sugar/nucleoside kinase (ribokinase family)
MCLGDIMIECVARLPSLPLSNETIILDSVSKDIGGPAFNIFWYLSKFGLKPRLIGAYGAENRHFIKKVFLADQLDVSGLIRVNGHSDSLFTILVGKNYHSFYLRSALPGNIEGKIRKQCGKPDFLILTGSRHVLIRKAFLSITDILHETIVIFNPSYAIYEYNNLELNHLLRNSDFIILNEQEAKQAIKILGIRNVKEMTRLISSPIIVTLGRKGLRIYHKSEIYDIEHFAEKAVNPIGAGDAFSAGFLYQIIGKRSIKNSARFGATLAAYVVESEQTRVFVPEKKIYERLSIHAAA